MVSVIIPTYNREKTLKRAIESVLKQGQLVSEVIIVDDNSCDESKSIIDEFTDDRIKYIKNNKSMGACSSRNIGIRNSSYDIIAFQDSDDEWLENKLQIQLNFILNHGYDVVCAGYNQIKDDKVYYIGKNVSEEEMYKEILKGNFVGTPTIIGKKECFLSNLFDENIPRFQDWELMIRLIKSYKVKFINDALVNAYVQNDSITRDNKKAIIAIDMIMKKNIDSFDRRLKSRYFRRMGVFSLTTSDEDLSYFIMAFNQNKDIKSFIDYILAKLKMKKVLKKIHKI